MVKTPPSFIGSELLSNDSPNTAGGETSVTTSAPLTPVTVMTSTSENDLQVGFGKVTDPDVDSFMGYAAIVPEYCRLEGMLVKGIV
jgi:xylulokinase